MTKSIVSRSIISSAAAIVSAIYVIAVLVVFPFSEFAVNDDWIFVRQVEAFELGIPTLSSLIDPSFIFQGGLGFLWGQIFGISFVSMRMLTVLATIILIFGVYKILKFFKTTEEVSILVLLTLVFNPVLFNSSLTFMTEIYFLVFFVWSLYFYLRDLREKSGLRSFILGTVLSGFAFLIRQYGVFLPLLVLALSFFRKDRFVKKLLIVLGVFAASFAVYIKWPRHEFGGISSITSNFVELKKLRKNLWSVLMSVPYFVYFSLPLLFAIERKKISFIAFLLVIAGTALLFKFDVFPLGSVFYLEGLHIKSNFRHIPSLGDTVFFKVGLAAFMSYLFFSLPIRKPKIKIESLLLLLTACLYFFILIIANDFYDRYLLPSTVVSLVLLATFIKKVSAKHWILLAAFCLFNFSLNLDFYTNTRLRWEQARAVQKSEGLITQVSVDGTFGKYFNSAKKNDYSGVFGREPSSSSMKCYVQQYSRDTDSWWFRLVHGTEEFLERYIDNPRVYNSRKKSIPRASKHIDELIHSEEYFSPMYNLIGRKAYVGSWCSKED
jgi:hypothetical protein